MSIRVNRNAGLKERKVYTFDNFKGVDFSTSPFKVAGNRATQAKNLIYENGTVRKRNGWKSLIKLPARINGLFSFEIEGEKVVLCYAGTRFYRLTYNDLLEQYSHADITESCTYAPAEILDGSLKSNRIQVHVNNNKAYIIGCGDYLVYGKWGGGFELRRVYNNEDTYIPTTTINIDEDSVDDENIGMLDDVNLLTSYRRNELLGVDADSGSWTVDTAIRRIPVRDDDNNVVKDDEGNIKYVNNPLLDGVQAINENSSIAITVYTYDTDGVTPIEISIDNRFEDKTLLFVAGDDNSPPIGSVNFAAGIIALNLNTKPQEEDTANIIVTFEKGDDQRTREIAGATISTVFGGGGSSNRLFVSGDSNNRNIHLWSEMYDFTYFPDNNYDKIGSDSSAIVGYVRAADGTLLVFKESNGSDSTAYYVTGTDVQQEDFRGDIVFDTIFYKRAGNIADTVYGKCATASLNGDNLILTRNGVKGVQLYENISTENYRVQERGRNINGKLLQHENLADACGFVYKDKYYLSVDETTLTYNEYGEVVREARGVVYIADSRFTFQSEEDINSSFNYEWWFWDNVDARVWCEIDGQLCFGTNGGFICVFTEDYADVTFQHTEANDLTAVWENSTIAYNISLDGDLKANDEIKFTAGELFSLFLGTTEILGVDSEGYVLVDEETVNKIYDGIKVYADWNTAGGLSTNTEYEIGEVDRDNLRFPLLLNGEMVTVTEAGFRLSKKISGKYLYVGSVDHENSEFKLKEFESGDMLPLTIYNNTLPEGLAATIKYKQNVPAEWYTPIYDLGTNMFSKTLFNITVATEPLVKGSIVAGYLTKNLERGFAVKGTRGFDFNDINFEDFSFEGAFASSFTLRAKERNFNFIVIRYVSDNQMACAVNSITVRYKINQLNKGVR